MTPAAKKPRPRLALTVQYAVTEDSLPARPLLRRWLAAAFERDAVVALRFVGNDEASALNQTYRGKPGPTNVLSFVYDDDEREVLRGDIVLCAPLIGLEALSQGKSLAAHYAHLVVHGALHLQAYDHLNEIDATRMEAREVEILARLRFADPYRVARAPDRRAGRAARKPLR